MDDERRQQIDRHAEQIHDALRVVVPDLGIERQGVLTRWVLVAEFSTPDGEAHLRTWRQPAMRGWDESGMLHAALYEATDGELDDFEGGGDG